jgi:hypothetical protein
MSKEEMGKAKGTSARTLNRLQGLEETERAGGGGGHGKASQGCAHGRGGHGS